ncbi:MAG: polyprenyl synthetase family protein [Desulfosarcina sp.]|nr:polyprenyl synthetase family protein [Desulfosarcina sp.]
MFDLKSYLCEAREMVDEMLQHCLSGPSTATQISRAMAYSVMAGGKRLRPVLCIAAAETVGGNRETVLPLACALELIHTYSLIHDDLPALDDDEKRRGKPTCHVQFDEATAILAGDALLTLAFENLATAGTQCASGHQHRWLLVILESLHRLKTGKMIEVSVEAGALVSGASKRQRYALHAYAQNIGLAFQVADDILNVKGDPKRLGKATGTDQIRGKNAYPSLLGLAGAETLAGQLVNNALKALDTFDSKANSLRAIAHYIIERNR